MRIGGTALSLVALVGGFLQAPFLHIHPDDHDHAAAPPLHSHYHPAQGAPAIDSPDDDAIDLEWSATTPSGVHVHFEVGPPERAFTSHVTFSSAAVQVPQYRGHDPPDAAPKQSRAPPA